MRRLRTVAALLPSILLAIALAEGGLLLVRRYLSYQTLRVDADAVGNYLQTVGTVYAVLLAFVVYVVWTQFNEARAFVEREANELVDLFRTAKGLPPSNRDEVQRRLATYVDAVLDREWAAMACTNTRTFTEVSLVLDALWEDLHLIEPCTENMKTIYAEMLARFNDLSDVRTNRLTSALIRIPFALKILLYSGAVIVVGSMWLFAVEHLWLHALLTGAMAGAISHVLYLIHDLDNCFSGDWKVPRAAFLRVQEYMRKNTSAPAAAI